MREGSWDQAFSIASGAFSVLSSESVSLSAAIDSYLAADALSLCDLPAFETSSMMVGQFVEALPGNSLGKLPLELNLRNPLMQVNVWRSRQAELFLTELLL